MKLYKPSNSTEGEWFMDKFCYHCVHEEYSRTGNEDDKMCSILTYTMLFEIDSPTYPKEWIYDKNNNPICTKFKKR